MRVFVGLVCLLFVLPVVGASDGGGPIVGGYCTDEPECFVTSNPGPVSVWVVVNDSSVDWNVSASFFSE